MSGQNLKTYIDMCGGCRKVGDHLGVTRITVWRWQYEGFPNTEWAGKTRYAIGISELCSQSGFIVSADQILRHSRIEQ